MEAPQARAERALRVHVDAIREGGPGVASATTIRQYKEAAATPPDVPCGQVPLAARPAARPSPPARPLPRRTVCPSQTALQEQHVWKLVASLSPAGAAAAAPPADGAPGFLPTATAAPLLHEHRWAHLGHTWAGARQQRHDGGGGAPPRRA